MGTPVVPRGMLGWVGVRLPGELRGLCWGLRSARHNPWRTPSRGPARAHETGPWEPSHPALAYFWSGGTAGTDGKADPDTTAGAQGKPLQASAPRCLEDACCEGRTIAWQTGGLEGAEEGPPPSGSRGASLPGRGLFQGRVERKQTWMSPRDVRGRGEAEPDSRDDL